MKITLMIDRYANRKQFCSTVLLVIWVTFNPFGFVITGLILPRVGIDYYFTALMAKRQTQDLNCVSVARLSTSRFLNAFSFSTITFSFVLWFENTLKEWSIHDWTILLLICNSNNGFSNYFITNFTKILCIIV